MNGGPAEAVVRVLLRADDPLVRAGLARLLADQAGLAVVAGAAPARGEGPVADVVLWDLGPDAGAALGRLPDAVHGGSPVVALVPDEASGADAWHAGARGVLFRDTEAGRLPPALAAVAQGLAVLEPAVAAVLVPARERPGPQLGAAELTPREREVLQLLAEGLSNRAIAARLAISEHTAKFHVNAILSKLGAESRTEAVVRAARLGLLVL